MARRNKGFPKYVEIYNQILKLIYDGMYPEGSKLPTENDLAKELNVSRMTLRQSLLLLKEDGIIEMRQGSGNYVKKAVSQEEVGMEEIGDIVKKVCNKEYKDIEYKMILTPATEYTQKIFQRKTPVVVEVQRSFRDENNKPVSCSLSMILTDILEDYDIDLNNIETIKDFMKTTSYSKGHRVRLEMKITLQNQMVKIKELQSDSMYYLLIIEGVYDIKGQLILHNKYYVPIENVSMLLNWYNK